MSTVYSVNSVNSPVLPPSPMVFFLLRLKVFLFSPPKEVRSMKKLIESFFSWWWLDVHMMMYRVLFTGLKLFIKVCWGTNILVSPCKTDTLWRIQKLYWHWDTSPKYLNWLMTSNHLQSIGLDIEDISASKFKSKTHWQVELDGKSYKMDVAGIFSPSIPYFVCVFLRPMTK